MTSSEYGKIISKNLKRIAYEHQRTQADISRDLKIKQSTLSTWMNGTRVPRMDKIDLLCHYFNCTRVDLMEPHEDEPVQKVTIDNLRSNDNAYYRNASHRIPVLGRVAAGVPIEMVEDVIDWEEIDDATAKLGTIFALSIKGDSMEPRIVSGDVVIVRQQDDAESGDIVIVSVNGDDATCKRLRKYKDGIELIPSNPSYSPMFYSNEEIAEKPVKVLGKVIELRGKL